MKPGAPNNIKVAVRVRPMNSKEAMCSRCVEVDTENKSITVKDLGNSSARPMEPFFFDFVYPEIATNIDLYHDIGSPILESAFSSYNGTIFAYGQTGSGKTYSMSGVSGMPGIVPQMNTELFERVAKVIETAKQPVEFLIQASYLEIYMEKIRDLLNPTPPGPLKVRESQTEGIYVDNLSKITVESASDVSELIMQGSKMRQVASTNMNDTSSRSHAIFTLSIQSRLKNEKEVIAQRLMSEVENKSGAAFDTGAIKANINLVDLAGSERQKDTGATGLTAKQGIAINLSLTCLGTVINALVKGTKHVPYRDSILTRILQESLGGNSATVMLANVSPADKNCQETISTLVYADRAKKIVNKIERNETKADKLIREMREEIDRLKKQLEERAMGMGMSTGVIGMNVANTANQGTSDKKSQLNMLIESMKLKDDGEDADGNWDVTKQKSNELNKMRIENLKKMAFYDTLLDSIKDEQMKSSEQLNKKKEEKKKLEAKFREVKEKVENYKKMADENAIKLQERLRELKEAGKTELCQNPKNDKKCSVYIQRIEKIKVAYQVEVNNLKILKNALNENRQQIIAAQNDAAASNAFIAGDQKLREEIARAEREKLEKKNKEKMEEEKQKLIEQYEMEVNKIYDEEEIEPFDDGVGNIGDNNKPGVTTVPGTAKSGTAETPKLSLLPGMVAGGHEPNKPPIGRPNLKIQTVIDQSGGQSGLNSASCSTPTTGRDAVLLSARNDLMRQVRDLRLQLVDEKTQMAAVQKRLETTESENSQLKSKITELEEKIKEGGAPAEKFTQAIKEMKRQTDEYVKQVLAKSQAKYNELYEENKRLRKQLQTLTSVRASPRNTDNNSEAGGKTYSHGSGSYRKPPSLNWGE